MKSTQKLSELTGVTAIQNPAAIKGGTYSSSHSSDDHKSHDHDSNKHDDNHNHKRKGRGDKKG